MVSAPTWSAGGVADAPHGRDGEGVGVGRLWLLRLLLLGRQLVEVLDGERWVLRDEPEDEVARLRARSPGYEMLEAVG